MKEQLIIFETAKLAKEKDFKLQSNPFGYITKFYRPSTGTLLSYGRTGRSKIDDLIYAPTQSLLQKWLREVHNIDVFVIPNIGINKEKIYCCYIKQDNIYFVSLENGFVWQNQSFILEETLETGLQEALKLIKD